MTRAEILETLSDAINLADRTNEPEFSGLGDRLFEVLESLKTDWNMEEE